MNRQINSDEILQCNENSRLYKLIVFSLLGLTAALLIIRIIFALQGHFLEQVSGSWAALAADLSKGIFYRPLADDVIGTGGTRWMPLYFALHAGLIRLTGDVFFTGHVISLFSSAVLLIAAWLIFKRAGLGFISSLIMITLLLCSSNLITAMTAVRGDILAAALNVLGIYFALSYDNKTSRMVFSSLLFSLTVMAKITSIYGITAVVLWLFLNDKKLEAMRFAGIFAGFTLLFTAGIQVLSSGRLFEIFTMCASGGTTIIKFIKSPFNFMSCITGTDTAALAVFTAGITAMLFKGRDILKSQYALYMAVTLAVTLFIFGSEGIVGNHLIDLHIASVLVIAGVISEYKLTTGTVIKCSAAVILIAFFINSHGLRQVHKKEPFLLHINKTAESLKDKKLIFAQNPWLPILMEKDVYHLDPFMFRIIDMEKPELLTAFYKRLDRGGFDAVVFDQNPLAPWIPEWYDYSHFGRNFMNHVHGRYSFKENFGLYYIYAPNKE
ncbi:MAG TPA: hypothetical protein P5120_18225 [Spirochaetota bacterium]|nr:hypothetical protein [Spirochaetota bacterium]HPF07550.1 hypothetical protein [Spirochaetota bacterium]HPJ40897.1 hypothetical protein [Spirochaetota bacterium]HPR39171.1 hypothetical protein [Spirochaetota bacterium]HRX49465.1 hypothetical protein [Spirochaetota bacterium]